MPKCVFCGLSAEKGTGKMYVLISGKVIDFCSNKCEKNYLKLKRKPLTTKWTMMYRNEHRKGSAVAKSESVMESSKKEAAKKEVN